MESVEYAMEAIKVSWATEVVQRESNRDAGYDSVCGVAIGRYVCWVERIPMRGK